MKRRKLTPDNVLDAVDAYEDGASITSIAEANRVSSSTVSKWIKNPEKWAMVYRARNIHEFSKQPKRKIMRILKVAKRVDKVEDLIRQAELKPLPGKVLIKRLVQGISKVEAYPPTEEPE